MHPESQPTLEPVIVSPEEPQIDNVTKGTWDYIVAHCLVYVIIYFCLWFVVIAYIPNELTAIAMVMIGSVSYLAVYNKIKRLFTEEFGASIGFAYEKIGDVDTVSGKLFSTGHDQAMSDVLSGTYNNKPMRIFSFRFTVGYGRDSTTYNYTVFEATLTGMLPDILLYSKGHANAISDFLSRNETIELEGDFNRYFRLRVPRGYEQEAYQVFTPNVMADLIDRAKNISFECNAHKIYMYATKIIGTRSEMQTMFDLSEYLVGLFDENTRGMTEASLPKGE